MASLLFFVLAVTTAAFATNAAAANAAAADDEVVTHLHFYLHDSLTGPNRTAAEVVKGPIPLPFLPGVNFGNLIVIDDPLTESPELSSRLVGRAQGFYQYNALHEASMLVTANLALAADGPYGGSTISILGRNKVTEAVRELSVVGGSRRFRNARGHVLWKTYSVNYTSLETVLELDVYLTTK